MRPRPAFLPVPTGWSAFFAAAALVLAALSATAADPGENWRISPRETRDGVRATVTGQLAALKAGDFSRAYGFASTGIRRQFSEEFFALMIRRGYPALLRQESAEVGVVRDDRVDRAKVDVTVVDRAGRRTAYQYFLVRERGGWKIEGVIGDARTRQGDI